MIPATLITASVVLLLAGGCGPQSRPPGKDVLTWRAIGSWSGQGNAQTESFSSDTGSLRVRWQTRNQAPTGTASFRLTLHSAISGRPLSLIADHAGQGTAQIGEDPRAFYLVVESANVDWSFAVEEGMAGRMAPGSAR